MFRPIALMIVSCLGFVSPAVAESVRIVSWNVSPSLYEKMERREANIRTMRDELNPDVLVLVEVAGIEELRRIVNSLGWERYHAVITDWSQLNENVHFALEAAVISKIPIIRAIEYDAARTDGHSEVFTQAGVVPGLVTEEVLSADGIKGFGSSLRWTDRGTIRVDLANGLTIFPLHLKSNFNAACKALEDAAAGIKSSGLPPYEPIQRLLDNGFTKATEERLSSALKRESVMAAVVRVAEQVSDDRTTILAGDWNTSYEPGLYGSKPEDCKLADYSCKPGPIPSGACTGADGYDDTIGGILEAGLTGSTRWTVLTKGLGRTYRSSQRPDPFADLAIDHFAVPETAATRFAPASKGSDTFGSDHFPIVTVWTR
jgi:hypothetical protein